MAESEELLYTFPRIQFKITILAEQGSVQTRQKAEMVSSNLSFGQLK